MTDDEQSGRPNKSAKKRELEALATLAEQMTGLTDRELKRLGVDADLRAALDLARQMKPSGSRNRQIKHCVKSMDHEQLQPVYLYLNDRKAQQLAVNQVFHELENLRDRLIDGGDDAIQALFEANPNALLERQRLRLLCRDAARERETGKPAGAGRKLFRYLRESLGPSAD